MTDRTSDREQILERLADFATALDRRDWALMADLMTPDVIGYGAKGPDAVVAQTHAHLGGVGPTQHLLGNHRVFFGGAGGDVDRGEDWARSLTYARVYHVGAGPMAGSFFECMGEYNDQWRRTESGWKLSRRVFDMQIQLGDFAVLR